MARKIVGITCSTVPASDYGPRQVLNRKYVWAVEQAGGVPIILPTTADTDVIGKYLGVVDGLLLSGGVDIAPEVYGAPPHPKLGEVDADRDTTEMPLIREALAQDMPIFGICRGIQSLNVALGGTLFQDLPSENPSEIAHLQTACGITRGEFSHTVRIAPDSRIYSIVGTEELPVNSLHHQALKDVAGELVVTGRATDGVIETAEIPSQKFVVAVQFHPEETAPHDEKSRLLFEAFVQVL